jgi:hypothetical protein
MTRAVLPAWVLSGLVALAAGHAAAAAPQGTGAHAKASSFAPRARSHSHVYGAPIQPRIVSSRAHHRVRAAHAK